MTKEITPPNKKVLFESMEVVENYAPFQNEDIANKMRRYTARLNELIASTLIEKAKEHYTLFNSL